MLLADAVGQEGLYYGALLGVHVRVWIAISTLLTVRAGHVQLRVNLCVISLFFMIYNFSSITWLHDHTTFRALYRNGKWVSSLAIPLIKLQW